MLTLRAAATRLTATRSFESLRELLPLLGFTAPAGRLDRPMRREAGLPGVVKRAAIAAGPGELRALLLDVGAAPLRESLALVARRLAAGAPQRRFVLLAVGGDPPVLAVACWTPGARGIRLRSLIADPARVLDSDAETLAALSAAAGDDDSAVYLRWIEILGREAIGARFYRALERHVARLADTASGRGSAEDRAHVALLHVSRILFLCFLQAKGWLDGDREFLVHAFDRCMSGGGHFDRRVLRPLFYGTLNTPPSRRAAVARDFGRIPFLNGGLFARSAVEKRCRELHFDDEAWGAVFGELLVRYRFTAREERSDWSEAAIDPEMLGRAFESLMAHRERRSSGSFYTPRALVARITDRTLEVALAHARTDTERRRALEELTILDPACGSGAFLVHALERVAELRRAAGDPRALPELRRLVLTSSIFGVDRNPMAVWLAELRLWLSVVIESEEEDPMRVSPLPNLDRNIRVGDALGGWDFAPGPLRLADARAIRQLRQRYARATGSRKGILTRALDREERARTLMRVERELTAVRAARCELIAARRATDLFGERTPPDAASRAATATLRARAAELRRELRRLRDGGALPFAFDAHFGDVAARGGFGVVVGNPPWVRLHRIPREDRARLRRDFAVYRGAAWEPGAAAAGAPRGFGAQVDLAALFTERSVRLLRPGGALGLLLPVKLWQSLAGGGVRRLLIERTQLEAIEECGEADTGFDAAVYPSIVVAARADAGTPPEHTMHVARHRGAVRQEWRVRGDDLPLARSAGAPWLLLEPSVRAGFDRLRRDARPLAETPFGRPLLGTKCGVNEAFIVQLVGVERGEAVIRDSAGTEFPIERELLRPAVRGEHLRGWSRHGDHWIVWPHDARGEPLADLPPLAAAWFARWKRRLLARTDCRGARRWWSLFRTEGAGAELPRVVWPDVSRAPTAVVLPAGDQAVPLNSCYVIRAPTEDDAMALAALLRSGVASSWLRCCAEPARGGYRRHLAWTVAMLPLPARWERARQLLAPLGRAGAAGLAVEDDDLTHAAIAAYGADAAELAPMLAWAA